MDGFEDDSPEIKGRCRSTIYRRQKRARETEEAEDRALEREFEEVTGLRDRNQPQPQPVHVQEGVAHFDNFVSSSSSQNVDVQPNLGDGANLEVQLIPSKEINLDQSPDKEQLCSSQDAQVQPCWDLNLDQFPGQGLAQGVVNEGLFSQRIQLPNNFVDRYLEPIHEDYDYNSDASSCLEEDLTFEGETGEHIKNTADNNAGENVVSRNTDEDDEENDFFVQVINNMEDEAVECESDDEGETIEFSATLYKPLEFKTFSTVKDSLILDLALAARHHLTYEALIQMFENKNFLLGQKFFPTSKKELWRVIRRKNSGIISHVFCSDCGAYVNQKKLLPEQTVCPDCKVRIVTKTAKYFLTISLRKQLQAFLDTPGAADLLSYRANRQKSTNTIADIIDGNEYERLQRECSMNNNDYTLTLNVDACKMSMNSNLKITPVFLRINEIHPLLRQKYMFMAALFVDGQEPKTNTFFKPIVTMLNDLSKRGITWKCNTLLLTSRFFTICFCVDGKARAQLLNMVSHQGKFGCTYCTIEGVTIGTTMRYPARPSTPFEDRTHNGMKSDMVQAHDTKTTVNGHKGCTVLALINHLDLARGSAADYLHNLYECAVPTHMNMIFHSTPHIDKMGYETMCAIIDARMKNIKTPNSISRKPDFMSIANRDKYKGNQWKNFIMHYAVPCLQNLVAAKYIYPLELLSNFSFILSQEKISEEDLIRADKCISEYLIVFEELYGIARTRLNMHALVHACNSVRNLGPYWAYSTFNFESWNAKILKHVTSPKGMLLQIVLRHLIQMKLELCSLNDPSISNTVRVQLRNILDKKKRRINAIQISEHCHFLRPSLKRKISARELEVLERENFSCNNVEVFRKAIINSVEYEPVDKKLSSKSDNSKVYTHQDTFCQIEEIVMFQNIDGSSVSGMFVEEFDVERRPFQQARHISELRSTSLPYFLQCTEVKAPVVTVNVLNKTYVIPLPNNYDID